MTETRPGTTAPAPATAFPARGRTAAVGRFLLHYLEMVAAMAVGMAVWPVWSLALGAAGWGGVLERPDVAALVMATTMALGMSVWMRFRGHRWRPVAEMAAAMYGPFVVLLVPLWLGVVSGHTVVMAGHVLMLPAMAGVMLLRRDEYTRPHRRRA